MTALPGALAAALADRYRLEGELGQGGMATVYLAHDLRHDRPIAVKVLRPELAAVIGAERFLTEIKTTANLQHPHILGLLDSGEAAGQLWYAMPYVEGESLRDRIQREKQLPVADAVRLAREVAGALDYAHRHGVIHRDIKPENILLHDGSALVADFGIALAASRAGDGTRMTETGMSLGTPHYMSPEQAMGQRDLDARSDVYALGAVLYEMLAGEPPFTGPTAQAIVARVVTEEPRRLTAQRRTVPGHVEAAVLTALNKLPADRFASAAEFARALEDPGYAATVATPAARDGRNSPSRRPAVPVLAALALVATALASWGWLRPPASADAAMTALRIRLGRVANNLAYVSPGLALSPDGRSIAYVDSVGTPPQPLAPFLPQLFLKAEDEPDGRPLAGTVGGYSPFFSPDGRWIAFATVAEKLVKVPVGGGSPTVISDSAGATGPGAWLDDGSIVFIDRLGVRLLVVADTGGPVRRVVTADSIGRSIMAVTPLPGSRGALFEACVGVTACSQVETWVYEHPGGGVRLLLAGASRMHYLPSGHVAFLQGDGTLAMAPFDLGTLAITGAPALVRSGAATDAVRGGMVVSRDGGTLLYAAGGVVRGAELLPDIVLVDRRGQVTTVPGGDSLRAVGNGGLNLSPDGRFLAFDQEDATTGRTDVFIKAFPDGPVSRLTFERNQNIRPAWSTDGREILWVSEREGVQELWRQRADGSGQPERAFGERRPVWDGRWSPDGAWLVYRTDDLAPGAGDILALNLRDSTVVTVAATQFEETGPELSPDGRWIAFSSSRSGRKEVYVRPFPGVEGGQWQVSVDGGTEPRWNRNGRELFFWNTRGEMVAAALTLEPSFGVASRTILFGGNWFRNDDSHFYDVFPDGRTFVALRLNLSEADVRAAQGHGDLVLVRGWGAELRRLLGK
ncbi:MAG TPA: protein kinase [Gemmatimonadales bacterium]|nr:protein kinase [Gemmatimonadales bacterium]